MKILLAILLACAFMWHVDVLAQSSQRYAIKLSESPQEADLTPLRDRVQSVARIPARVYEVKDAGGATTIHVLAAGEYASIEEASAARAEIAEKLGLPAGAMAIVPLPR